MGSQQSLIDAEMRATRRAILGRYRHLLRKDPRTLTAVEFLALADHDTIVTAILIAALGIDSACAAALRTRNAGVLSLAGQHGLPDWYADRLSTSDFMPVACERALSTGEPVYVGDVSASPIFADHPTQAVVLAAGVRAMHCYPLKEFAGGTIGLLALYYEEPGMYPPQAELAAAAALALSFRSAQGRPGRPVLVALDGHLDTANAAEIAARAYAAISATGPPALVLDLEELEFLTVLGARLLLDIADACASRGVSCYILAPPGSDARLVLDRLDGAGPMRLVDNRESLPEEHRP